MKEITQGNANKMSTGGVVYGPTRLVGQGSDNQDRPEDIIPAEKFEKALSNSVAIKHLEAHNGHPPIGVEALVKAIAQIEQNRIGKIGIAITTHNRQDSFKNTLKNINSFLPGSAVVAVVDDASNFPYVHRDFVTEKSVRIDIVHRFESNVGIARAKNKCLELLYNAGCEHFFLFDDDTYPLVDNWWKPYVESREPHLMYIFEHFANGKSPNDMIKVYQDGEISAYTHVRGCMLYYKRICLDVAGGMDIAFNKWGREHGDLSNRIYNFGLTRFRYMDVANSKGLFYSADEMEHGTFVSTVPGAQRAVFMDEVKPIYDYNYNRALYREFREPKSISQTSMSETSPLFLTCYFTSLPDPQRGNKPMMEDPMATFAYQDSIVLNANWEQEPSIVILNDMRDSVPELNDQPQQWIKVNVSINPYFQRWVSYYEYLLKHQAEISWVFMTDCTDVELLKMPEPQRGVIYVGDEPDRIGASKWLQQHHRHPDLTKFYHRYRSMQMVNAGILGGYIEDVLPFIRAIIDTYSRMTHESHRHGCFNAGITDMGVFNYVAYTQFGAKISHGPHVNTVFKANERNDISWFKHK